MAVINETPPRGRPLNAEAPDPLQLTQPERAEHVHCSNVSRPARCRALQKSDAMLAFAIDHGLFDWAMPDLEELPHGTPEHRDAVVAALERMME